MNDPAKADQKQKASHTVLYRKHLKALFTVGSVCRGIAVVGSDASRQGSDDGSSVLHCVLHAEAAAAGDGALPSRRDFLFSTAHRTCASHPTSVHHVLVYDVREEPCRCELLRHSFVTSRREGPLYLLHTDVTYVGPCSIPCRQPRSVQALRPSAAPSRAPVFPGSWAGSARYL